MFRLMNEAGEVLDPKSLGLYVEWVHSSQLTSGFEHYFLYVPQGEHELHAGMKIGGITYSYNLVTSGLDVGAFEDDLRVLNDFLSNEFGKPTKTKLFRSQDNRTEQLEYYREVILSKPISISVNTRRLVARLELVTRNPFMTKLQAENSQGSVSGNESVTIPIATIGVPVKPLISLTGTGTNVRLSTKGRTISIGDMAGETVEIDLSRYVVKRGSIETIIKIPHGFSFYGEDELTIQGSSALDLSWNITWHQKRF